MTSRAIRISAFLFGGLVTAAVQLAAYDPVQQSPPFLKPARLIVFGVLFLLCTNILVFTVNLFKTFLSARGLKDEEELERRVAPALQGQIEDERIMRYAQAPFFAGLGILTAGILWLASGNS